MTTSSLVPLPYANATSRTKASESGLSNDIFTTITKYVTKECYLTKTVVESGITKTETTTKYTTLQVEIQSVLPCDVCKGFNYAPTTLRSPISPKVTESNAAIQGPMPSATTVAVCHTCGHLQSPATKPSGSTLSTFTGGAEDLGSAVFAKAIIAGAMVYFALLL